MPSVIRRRGERSSVIWGLDGETEPETIAPNSVRLSLILVGLWGRGESSDLEVLLPQFGRDFEMPYNNYQWEGIWKLLLFKSG